MKLFSFLLIFTIPLISQAQEESKKNYNEAITLIEVWLDAQKDFEKLPGISASITKKDSLFWSGAYGYSNLEVKKASSPTTLYSICSISKLFTSVAIMKLYDEGKLRLDDRVEDLLPQFDLKQKYPLSAPITVRGLLTHSSGLPRESAHPYWTGPDFPFPTKKEIDSQLSEQETLYPASTYFQYSNLGLSLLGEIVEEISGMPYDEYVQKNILDPLKLANTRPEMPKKLHGKQLAIGYSALTREGERDEVKFFQANGITPAAGYTSTVEDLGKFASWQFALRSAEEPIILKPSTLKDMQRVQWMDPNWSTTWGLGFVVNKGPDGKTWVGHGGSCPGYRSSLVLDLSNEMAYSVMINAGGTNPQKYIMGIYGILSKVEAITESEKDLSDYVGFYNQQPWGSESYMGSWNGKLVAIRLPNDTPGDLNFFKHVEGDIFQRIRDDKEGGELLIFERDKTGKVVRASQHGNFSEKKEGK